MENYLKTDVQLSTDALYLQTIFIYRQSTTPTSGESLFQLVNEVFKDHNN